MFLGMAGVLVMAYYVIRAQRGRGLLTLAALLAMMLAAHAAGWLAVWML